MLAEKFFLVLETLRSHASDGSVKVISTAPHVPANVLPSQKQRTATNGPNAGQRDLRMCGARWEWDRISHITSVPGTKRK